MPQAVVSSLRALFGGAYPRYLELRALHPTRAARKGRFKLEREEDLDRVVAWVDRAEQGKPQGIYAVMNPLSPRADGGATKDEDITRREWLLIDIDAVRPSGISATKQEMTAALKVTRGIVDWLMSLGWPMPFIAASGNGGHIMWRVDLGTTDEETEAVRKVLDVLALRFNSSKANVDSTVYNLSRIWRLPGTWARKGKDTTERPWRRAKLVREGTEVVTLDQLREVAGLINETKSEGKAEIAKIQTWLHKHHGLGKSQPYTGRQGRGVRWVFKVCPWEDSHRDRSAYIIRFDSGQLSAGCLHKNCPGNRAGWDGLQKISPEPLKGVAASPGPVGPSTAATPGLTDLGNAKRLVTMYGESLRYVPEWGQWLEFDGGRWQPDNTGIITQRAATVAANIFAEAAAATSQDAAKRLTKFAVRCESLSTLSAMEKLARSEPNVSVPVATLDSDNWKLNCKNGLLDLKTGELLKPDRKWLNTKSSPVPYHPDGECPEWDAFLDRIFGGDEALISFIHRALGYCLTGSVSEQVMFFCHGVGANGKTTFLRTMQHILGDYSIQTDASLLMSSPGDKHPTGLADLLKVRFAAASETDRGRHFSEALVKQITGDDIMVARKMRQDFFRFEPTHKLWLAANYKPIIKGNDVGIWRRIVYVPFEVTIPKEERDRGLLEKLRSEAPGILTKVVQGCRDWQEQGLNPPTRVLDKTAAYQEEMDLLREFFEECCRLGDNRKVARAQLYDAYRDWCEGRYDKPVKFTFFNRLVEERGFVLQGVQAPGGTTVKIWNGIALGSGDPMGQVVELGY